MLDFGNMLSNAHKGVTGFFKGDDEKEKTGAPTMSAAPTTNTMLPDATSGNGPVVGGRRRRRTMRRSRKGKKAKRTMHRRKGKKSAKRGKKSARRTRGKKHGKTHRRRR